MIYLLSTLLILLIFALLYVVKTRSDMKELRDSIQNLKKNETTKH